MEFFFLEQKYAREDAILKNDAKWTLQLQGYTDQGGYIFVFSIQLTSFDNNLI